MAHPAPPSDPPLAASPATAVDTAADDGAPATSRLSVRLEDVGRAFDTPHGAHTVLRDVSLTIAPGEVLASAVVADLADSASDLTFGPPREHQLAGIERPLLARPAVRR